MNVNSILIIYSALFNKFYIHFCILFTISKYLFNFFGYFQQIREIILVILNVQYVIYFLVKV